MPTERTAPGAEGRLFPAIEWGNGWALSLQADKAGYQCSPRAQLDVLEDYDTVEARVVGPFPHEVDVSTLGLPTEIVSKFTSLDTGASIGCDLSWDEVEILKQAVMMAGMNPNAGIPSGRHVWSGRSVFHGASAADAAIIEATGIDILKSSGGYFGHAFYVAEDLELALSNYAEFSDDEGAVLEFCIEDGARILDMRNEGDAEEWRRSGLGDLLGRTEIAARAVRLGIAGVYDRSVGGLAIYDPRALGAVVRVHAADAGTTPSHRP